MSPSNPPKAPSDQETQTLSSVPPSSSSSPAESRDVKQLISKEALMTTEAVDLETYLHQTLNICNKMAKMNFDDPALTAQDTQQSIMGLSSEVAAAKMLNYCIRMLHADGWHPPTVIRAMVLREYGLEAGMKTTLYKALRERREEIKASEAKRAGVVHDGIEVVVEKGTKKSETTGKGTGRRGTTSKKDRRARAVISSGTDVATRVDTKSMVTDGRAVHEVGADTGRNGPFMSLI